MGGRQCLAKLLATLMGFLLVSDTTLAASELPPDGSERMLPPSVGLGDKVGCRKINPIREGSTTSISVKNEELRIGLSIRVLRSVFPSPPPAPHRNPPSIPKSPPPRPPTSPIHYPPPPPPYQQ